MKWFLIHAASIVVGLGLMTTASVSQDKDPPQEKFPKPALGDKEELAIQNCRVLKVRNETATTLTVFLQFRTLKDNAWTWTPADPASSSEAISFEVETGKEVDVKYEDEPVAASRMRVWATSSTHKWLRFKSRDAWLVPEKNDEGEHIYAAEAMEPYTLAFARTKEKEETPFDENAGERTYPTEGEDLPPPPEEISWDDVPPGYPVLRNLSVLPVQVIGPNAIVRIKNLGHFNINQDRRAMLQRLAPPSVPVEIGAIGSLFHYGVKNYYLVGLKPGTYRVFLSPGDEFPYDGNDARMFNITKALYPDAAVLPVAVAGNKVTLKVKNVGTDAVPFSQHLMVQKLPMGMPVDHGPIGPLNVNGIKVFPTFNLPAGAYRAFVSPGDAAPFQLNDAKIFGVAAATHVDLDVLPVQVMAGQVTIGVKNIGSADAPAAQHLYVKKLPVGVPVDHGPVGPLAAGKIKVFPKFNLLAGNYRAYVDPDQPPYQANDFEDFNVAVPLPKSDLEASFPVLSGGKVHGKIKNNGPGKYMGVREGFIEKKMGLNWVSASKSMIGPLNPGDSFSFEAAFTGSGMYRIRLSPGDANPGNDMKMKALP